MTTDPLVESEPTEPIGPPVSEKVAKPKTRASLRPLPFLFAFVVAVVAFLALGTAVALGVSRMYEGRILPSVHVGSVDLSGLNREQAISKLTTEYGYLSDGQVTVQTPVGAAKITYKEIGRGPDAAAMADAALQVGRQGDPIANAAAAVRAVATGDNVGLMVKLDPTLLATRLRALTGSNAAVATDAKVVSDGSGYKVVPGVAGHGIDEAAIAASIIAELSKPAAAKDFQVGGSFVELQPRVSDAEAQAALALVQTMAVDLPLSLGTQTWTVPAETVKSWITFGLRSDGTYGPVADPAMVSAGVGSLASTKINQNPVEPTFLTDKSTGKPVGVTGGKDGIVVDVDGTAQAVEAYLDALGSAKTPGANVTLVATVSPPKLTDDQAKVAMNKMEIIGSATVVFFPGDSNGFGANIRVPAQLLNGLVVAPGATFSFLDGVGAIDAAHGFKMGGVIIGGKSDHTGAIGGGICSASTTMFHAALAAGLQIVERHPHYYFIDRYADSRFPKGTDATVYYNGSSRVDLKWINDTPYPIVIRGSTTPGATSTITFQLWSVPTGRTVAFSKPVITNYQTATNNPPIYTNTLAPGKTNQLEYRTDGFNVSVSRTVRDAAGNVIHSDLFTSAYARVNGQLEIGGPAPGQGTPPPATPEPSTPPSAPPSVTPSAAPTDSVLAP
jgi:vancomycin resistance protein YoaR